MTEISVDTNAVTLINVFTVEPDQQEKLVDLLIEATRDTMQRIDGFVSANIHKSADGVRVTNYAQWRSAAHFEAMLQNPAARPHMQAAAKIATSFDAHLYEVVECVTVDG